MTPLLQDQTIRLLPLTAGHKEAYVTLANIPVINHRINKPLPYLDSHFEELLEKIRTMAPFHVWMIEHAGILCGVVNTASRVAGIFQGGYWIHPDQQGHGVASRAVGLMKDYLFTQAGAQRVQAVVEPDNAASIRVLEKCGYRAEGLLRKYYLSLNRGLIDVWMYAAVKEEQG